MNTVFLTRGLIICAALAVAASSGCCNQPAKAPRPTTADVPTNPSPAQHSPPQDAPQVSLREMFPGVRIDPSTHTIEFDAAVSPMLVPDPQAPLFYLEQLVCSPDTREHESLLVTRVLPSHVHAAMLLAGMQPGDPGGWRMFDNLLQPIDPRGDRVELRFVYASGGQAGETMVVDPLNWIVSADGKRTFVDAMSVLSAEHGRPVPGWVFAGSRIVSAHRSAMPTSHPATEPAEIYEADGAGTVIGLTSFGSELISWSQTISPDAGIDAPEWVAKMEGLPQAGTPVVVRIRPAPGR